MSIFVALIMSHAIADFPLQSDFMAKNKVQGSGIFWPYVLGAHALTHGAGVWMVTGSMWAGLAETGAHWVIDYWKGEKLYGLHVDQALHVACKVLWVVMI